MRRAPHLAPPTSRLSGLTLVEVLMSIFVTGIGIMSVITLLPLAFVRSVQATNLTNSTILRYNAESAADVDPLDLVYVYPFWQPNTAYAVGQTVLAVTGVGGNNHMFQVQAGGAGTSGGSPPLWNLTPQGQPAVTTTDGGVTWVDAGLHDHYVIDPLGAYAVGGPLGTGVPNGLSAIPRFPGGQYGVAFTPPAPPSAPPVNVSQIVSLADSWVELARGPVTASTATSVTLNNVDLTGLPQPQPPGSPPPAIASRAVMIDATGKASQTRMLTAANAAADSVSWSTNDPLLNGFSPVQARIETQEQRYTWMLTINRASSGQASVVVTVFFHRAQTSPDEQVFSVSPAAGPPPPSPNQFTVSYNLATTGHPNVKKGGFLFDVSYGQWYRVTDVLNDNNQSSLDVILDQPRPATNNPQFGAVFMRGIVDVYPIGQI